MGEDRGDPVRDFLGDVAGRDSRRVHGLRCALEVLARGPDGPLRELARAVLKGELSLRDAALSDVYGERLGAAFDAFWTRYRVLAPGGQDDTG
jgi:hypothetical protein